MAKILIVDDDPDVVAATTLFLEKEGHEVASAPNRADGMAAIRKAKPDLLVLDVMMEQPDDGIAMAQDLKKEGFDRPILMMTSIGRVTGMDFGKDEDVIPVDDFVEKPVKPAVLVEKVKALLKG
jgi:DNA-binding response OmpR family regulator